MRKLFEQLILRASSIDLAKYSQKDHHGVPAFDYMCLHRTEALTVKLYRLENNNPNSGFLVHPHDHRYAFDTFVLGGRVEHFLFEDLLTGAMNCEKLTYNAPDEKTPPIVSSSRAGHLIQRSMQSYGPDETYRVGVGEIHTLRVVNPAILGIVQYKDTRDETSLYLPIEEPGVRTTIGKPKGMSQAYYDQLQKEIMKELQLYPF